MSKHSWLKNLQKGDIISDLGSGNSYVVIAKDSDDNPIVTRTLTATNETEWSLYRAIRP